MSISPGLQEFNRRRAEEKAAAQLAERTQARQRNPQRQSSLNDDLPF